MNNKFQDNNLPFETAQQNDKKLRKKQVLFEDNAINFFR